MNGWLFMLLFILFWTPSGPEMPNKKEELELLLKLDQQLEQLERGMEKILSKCDSLEQILGRIYDE